jgi:hypothetical protein
MSKNCRLQRRCNAFAAPLQTLRKSVPRLAVGDQSEHRRYLWITNEFLKRLLISIFPNPNRDADGLLSNHAIFFLEPEYARNPPRMTANKDSS